MRTLIRNEDLKTLFVGAAFAVGLGLVAGAAMQPRLSFGEGPEGPQMLTAASGRRAAPATDSPYAVYAAYPQALPDYVIGTDWTRPPPPEPPPAADPVMPYESRTVAAYARDAAASEPFDGLEAADAEAPEDLAVATPG